MANMNLSEDFGKLQSNIKPVRQEFGIADMSIVINLLTKLYSNPRQTLTQEYISNARDANREIGASRPIEISVPTMVAPTMIIRDFGPGLSPERIDSVFLLYGASTKRASNSQTGGFGIGAKSAWAYVDSFTITTYIDGTKRTYIAHKSSGNGNLDKISEELTKEPNGTEIQVPIKNQDIPAFKNSILRTIFFWDKAEFPILKGITSAEYDFSSILETKISSEFSVYEHLPEFIAGSGYYEKKTTLVIDGIPYTIDLDDHSLERISNKVKQSAVFHLPNGQLHIAPSREEIIKDDHNKKYLSAKLVNAMQMVDSYIKAQLNKHTDIPKALESYLKLYKNFHVVASYKNYTLSYSGISYSEYDKKDNAILNRSSFREYKLKTFRNSKKESLNKSDNSNLKISAATSDLYYVDSAIENESAIKFGYRIRKLLEEGTSIYVVNQNSLHDKMVKDLRAKPLSTIDISDYAQERSAKTPTAKKLFCAHYYKGDNLAATQRKAEDFTGEEIYSYIDSVVYSNRAGEYLDLIKYITKKLRIPFFFVAKSNETHVKSNPLLVNIDDFIATHKMDDKFILEYLKERLAGISYLGNLKSIKKLINNQELVGIIELMSTCRTYDTIPKQLVSSFSETPLYKKHKTVVDNAKETVDRLESTYPILVSFAVHSGHADRKKQASYEAHFVKYINDIKIPK